MIIATNYVGTDRGIFTGEVYRYNDLFSVSSVKRLFTPGGVGTLDRLPSGDNYGNRQYLCGAHTANILIDEDYRVLRQGMAAPNTLPSVTVGTGTTSQICYWRFFDEVTGERSPLSDGLSVTGSIDRAWTNLPTEVPNEQIVLEGTATFAAGTVTGVQTNFGDLRPGDRIAVSTALTRWATVKAIASATSMTVDDTGMAGAGVELTARPYSRASHVELWVSVFGSFPRLAVRVRLGTPNVSESTATLALGEAEIDSFEAMPYGFINLFYNDRQLLAGVEGHRDTIYLSAIGFPERHEGLRFITRYNEPVIGMFKFRDYVVVLCPDSSYRLQGYTEDDYSLEPLDPRIGGLTHLGNAVTDTYALVPCRKGMQVFNGSFHQGIPTRRSEWTFDCIDRNGAFERGFCAVNPNDETYQFYPRFLDLRQPPQKAYVYVGTYDTISPQAGGTLSTPEWLSDTHYIEDPTVLGASYTTSVAYLVPTGQKIGKFYRADNKGQIWQEDETDTIAFPGTSVVVARHDLFDDPGGGANEGKTLIRAWSYVESEYSGWRLNIWPGDERAYCPETILNSLYGSAPLANQLLSLFPNVVYHDNVAASQLSEDDYQGNVGLRVLWQPQTVHIHKVGKAGRGFSFEYRFIQPRAAHFYGFGGVYGPGVTKRPLWSAVDFE